MDFFELVWMETESLTSRESQKDIAYTGVLHIHLDERDSRTEAQQDLRPNGFTETGEETDYQVKSFVQKYIPIFVELCYKKFNASAWRESDHTAIRKRINELKSLIVDGGRTKVVTGSFLTDLVNIEGIIDTYYEAKKATAFSSFVSVSDANSKITKA